MYATRLRPRLSGASTSVQVQPFDRVQFWNSLDAYGRPPHVVAADGSWISLVHGVNPDGSFQTGTDPLTGKYWPGDAQAGNRPIYFNELGPVPFMDPNGLQMSRADAVNGWGGGSGSVAVGPAVLNTPTTVSKTPPAVSMAVQTNGTYPDGSPASKHGNVPYNPLDTSTATIADNGIWIDNFTGKPRPELNTGTPLMPYEVAMIRAGQQYDTLPPSQQSTAAQAKVATAASYAGSPTTSDVLSLWWLLGGIAALATLSHRSA